MKIEDIAYTAGLLDGEGSIQINPHTANRNPEIKHLNLVIQISSGDKKTLEWLKEIWVFGTLTSWKSKSGKLNYNWRLYGSKYGEDFLKQVFPYLRIVKEKAHIALEFCKLKLKKNMVDKERFIKNRIELALAMRKLNGVGKGRRIKYKNPEAWR